VEVKNGRPLSAIIADNPIFPPIVAQMLAVGEETGQTDVVLVKVAEFYEEEVDVAIEGLSSIIEPTMIVIMGGMVGLIAASVMSPIAGLAQNIK
jgi:type IV pilus assembly protein PilC